MFTRLDDGENTPVSFSFNATEVIAREGDNIATALLAAGIGTLRHAPVSQSPRGAFCMMGVCFECLVSIDGGAPVQACMTQVRSGICVTGIAMQEDVA